VIDNVLVMNGSYNWTVSASTNNRENVMVTNFGVYVQEFSHEFERMWNDQKEFANF
jgi:phosphatidylserine/phosphatidylglycerophosphate/cardiolipin synthase-like enzyme